MAAAPGSGNPPGILNLSITCSTTDGQGILSFTANKAISETFCSIALYRNGDINDAIYTDSIARDKLVKPILWLHIPNGRHLLVVENGEAANQQEITVDCPGRISAPQVVYRLRTAPAAQVVYRLRTAATNPPRVTYRLKTASAQVAYRLRTVAPTPAARQTYQLLTAAEPQVAYRLLTEPDLAEGHFNLEISQDGNYLYVTVPYPGNTSQVGYPGPPPVVLAKCWDGTPYTGLLLTTANLLPIDGPLPANAWTFRLGTDGPRQVLDTDGVYRVRVLKWAGQPNQEQIVAVMLRLQLEHARQLLTPTQQYYPQEGQLDYNPAADELELWLGAAALAFEIKGYDDVHYLLSELYANLLATF